MKLLKKGLLLGCLTLLLSGCFFKRDTMEGIDIYTTSYPINYLIDYLYGDNAKINSIFPTGVNIDEFEISDKKVKEYSNSDLFVFNSLDIDRDYAVKLINKKENLKIIDVSMGMNYEYDVHELWLNPYNYLMMAKNTKDSLNEYISNPYLNEEINNNFENLKYELSRLDALYKETLKDTNYTTIVTDNSLFKFLEKYNIEVIVLEEEIITITIKDEDNLSDISKEYNISISDILTYNNKTDESLKIGETIKLPIKVIDASDVLKVKKLINEEKIKYIYSDRTSSNEIVNNLVKDEELELITINTMYSIDGGVTNSNETYLTIMNDNLEFLKNELYE